MNTSDEVDQREYPCLVRVTDGKELKLSTRVRIRSDRSMKFLYISLHDAG